MTSEEKKVFYKNGQLWRHYFYVNGEQHGEYRDWHDNGALWEQCFYYNV